MTEQGSGSALLGLFAKAPIPGHVKTRLCPPLTPEQAAEGYEAMLRDIVEQTRAHPGRDRALWFTPATAREWFAKLAPGFALHVQEGPDLSARMRAFFRKHAAAGYERVVLRGTDSPTLPQARVDEAFDALEHADLVLCPDEDGGYNLIGLRRPGEAQEGLFDVELSTASVLEATLTRARELGLTHVTLAGHHDVDTRADLDRLVPSERTPRTTRWLAGLRASIDAP